VVARRFPGGIASAGPWIAGRVARRRQGVRAGPGPVPAALPVELVDRGDGWGPPPVVERVEVGRLGKDRRGGPGA
jgi:hypothetical protein